MVGEFGISFDDKNIDNDDDEEEEEYIMTDGMLANICTILIFPHFYTLQNVKNKCLYLYTQHYRIITHCHILVINVLI